MSQEKIRLLFVCMGNICRSPSAEAVMKKIVEDAGLENRIEIDSAGTIGFHAGQPADSRMRSHAFQRGYKLESISRPVEADDFERFDYIIGMDDHNISELKRKAITLKDVRKIHKMTDFSQKKTYNHIPDPYYGGASGFELVLDLLEDACQGLLQHLREEYGIK